MSESHNVELVKQVYATVEEEDISSLLQMYAPNIEWQYPDAAEIPYGGLRHGHEGVVQFFELHDQADDILDLLPKEFIAQGDRVIVLGSYRGRAKSTGREWGSDFVHVYTIIDDKIQRFEAYFNTAAFVEAHRA